jgi:bacterioferritin-associated ferredoxin
MGDWMIITRNTPNLGVPMMVCVCASVPESDFLAALEEAKGDWRLAAMHSGAGQCCGSCRPFLAQVAQQAIEEGRVLLPSSDATVDPSAL